MFGPVATVHQVSDDAEAVRVANGTPFGLEGYVFAGNEERGMAVARQVRAGGVKVNGSTMLSLNLMAPRPAWGLSGLGVEGPTETFDPSGGSRELLRGWPESGFRLIHVSPSDFGVSA
jgi:phenylacetaldehyde dehydrogenase